jgi:hypothetical protein
MLNFECQNLQTLDSYILQPILNCNNRRLRAVGQAQLLQNGTDLIPYSAFGDMQFGVIAALMILGPIIGNVFSKVNSSLSNISADGGVIVTPITTSCTSGSASALSYQMREFYDAEQLQP